MSGLLARDLVVVTGKGGVGKSTVAAALGLVAARRGLRTIVAEVSARDDVSRALRGEAAGREEEILPGLHHLSVDPQEAMEEYLVDQLPSRPLADLLTSSRTFTYLTAATPGLKELVTIGKIWELAQLDRKVKRGHEYDLVVVDAPATGHGIGFLQTPRTFAAIARVGPIRSQAEALDAYITDHGRTGAVIVALPEEMPVNESELLEAELTGEVGVAVDRVYMNGLYPECFSDGDAERLEAAAGSVDGGARAAVRAALSEHRRAHSHHYQLDRLRSVVRAEVVTLPFIFEPELGVAGIERLAGELSG